MNYYSPPWFKCLESIDPAPSTSEAEIIRASATPSHLAPNECHSAGNDVCLIEADIIDEQHLLARLKALRHGRSSLAHCPDGLMSIIVQRAIAELKHLLAAGPPFPVPDEVAAAGAARNRWFIAALESRPAGDRFSGELRGFETDTLFLAMDATKKRIERLDNLLEWHDANADPS